MATIADVLEKTGCRAAMFVMLAIMFCFLPPSSAQDAMSQDRLRAIIASLRSDIKTMEYDMTIRYRYTEAAEPAGPTSRRLLESRFHIVSSRDGRWFASHAWRVEGTKSETLKPALILTFDGKRSLNYRETTLLATISPEFPDGLLMPDVSMLEVAMLTFPHKDKEVDRRYAVFNFEAVFASKELSLREVPSPQGEKLLEVIVPVVPGESQFEEGARDRYLFSPLHGYLPVQHEEYATVKGKKLLYGSFDVLRFEQMEGGIWIPTKMLFTRHKADVESAAPTSTPAAYIEVEVTNMKMNPSVTDEQFFPLRSIPDGVVIWDTVKDFGYVKGDAVKETLIDAQIAELNRVLDRPTPVTREDLSRPAAVESSGPESGRSTASPETPAAPPVQTNTEPMTPLSRPILAVVALVLLLAVGGAWRFRKRR